MCWQLGTLVEGGTTSLPACHWPSPPTPSPSLPLAGIRALKVSALGRGVAAISPMLTITRLHPPHAHAAAAVSYMRRLTALAADFARRRAVSGKRLCEQPLAVRR